MVKYLFLSFFLLISCNFGSKSTNNPDSLMHDEYLYYLQVACGSKSEVHKTFSQDLNIIYFYKDFEEVGMKFLIFYNKLLNQQYAFFCDYGVEKKFTSIKKAPFIKNLSIGNSTFNRDILKVFAEIESTVEPRFKGKIKKIVVGSKVGGAIANMLVSYLIKNNKMRAEEFEVIDFNTSNFANNFDFKFNRTSISSKNI